MGKRVYDLVEDVFVEFLVAECEGVFELAWFEGCDGEFVVALASWCEVDWIGDNDLHCRALLAFCL